MKKIQIDISNPEIREVWETALAARKEVASWPAWKRGERVERRKWECKQCTYDPDCPMLRDAVWNTIAGPKDLLCMQCAESRLKRRLVVNDLYPCAANHATFVMVSRMQDTGVTSTVANGKLTTVVDLSKVKY